MNVLVLCTGNSCRSQMAEGFLKSYDPGINVFSAGTKPAEKVHPMAIQVMKEIDIDIEKNKPENVNKFIDKDFDYVITVCDSAKMNCPVFEGKVKKTVHFDYPDPAEAVGPDEEVLSVFRRVRDHINEDLYRFYCEISKISQ